MLEEKDNTLQNYMDLSLNCGSNPYCPSYILQRTFFSHFTGNNQQLLSISLNVVVTACI